MKKMSKIKLNYLAQNELNEKEMDMLVGGEKPPYCCSCWAAGHGGSSDASNRAANKQGGHHSKDCGCTDGPTPGDETNPFVDSEGRCWIETNCVSNWDPSCHGKG